MAKSKKKASRKVDSEVSVCVTMENPNDVASRSNGSEDSADAVAMNPPSVDGDDTTIERINLKTARVAEEYKRVKAQLESEGLKIQHLTERRTTEQALSNPNASTIDRMFTMDKSGLYFYKGSSTCCLDATSQTCVFGTNLGPTPCKHELCARATFLGITWKELDTIKWYDTRIRHEKTPRRKSALAKQREVELARIKQTEDEELAKYARRYKRQDHPHAEPPESAAEGHLRNRSKTTQDLEQSVFKARISMVQMFKYAAFVGARRRNMADMAKCSDAVSMAQKEKAIYSSNLPTLREQLEEARLRLETLNKNEEWYKGQIAEAAKATQSLTSWQMFNLDLSSDITKETTVELCTLVTGLLTDVGMPVETIDNLEHAQSALRHVMSQPASIQSPHTREKLDSIKEVIYNVQNLPKNNRAFSPSSSARPPDTITPDDLRNQIINNFSDEGHIASPVYAQLTKIEDKAHNDIRDVYEQLMDSPTELVAALEKIRENAVAKSPVPKITEKMLDIYNSTFNDMSKANAIVQDLGHTSDQVLVAKISGFVFVRAEKKAEWLVDAFTIIEAAFEAVYMNPLPERLSQALQRVKSSVQTRAQAKAHQEAAIVLDVPPEHALPSTKPAENTSQIYASGQATTRVAEAIPQNPPSHEAPVWTAHEQSIIDTIDAYNARTASVYSAYLSRHRYCPGCATLRIAQMFAALLAKYPDRLDHTIAALAAGHCATTGDDAVSKAPTESSVPERWMLTVSHGVRYITDMFHTTMSGLDVDWSLEQKATITGSIIVTVMANMVLDLEFEKILTPVLQLGFARDPLAQFEAVLNELSVDERLACAPFRNDCFRHERDRSRDSQLTRPSTSTDTALLPLKLLNPGAAQVKADTAPASTGVTSTTVTARIVPGGPWHKLLPRGQRYQSHDSAMKAAAKVASMDPSAAKKMSDFCVLEQNAYEQAGLTLPPDVLYCMEELRQFAFTKPGTRARDPHNCQCPRCIASRIKSVDKPSKFVEDFSEIYRSGFEITIDGRAITEDEVLDYTGATLERIRSIASGEANLEYICWVARKVSFAADAAQAADTLPVRRFEEFFTHYAPMPRELELALEFTKGKLWQSPECLKNYPTEDGPLIHDILATMVTPVANEPPFSRPNDETWQADSIVVPACADDISSHLATEHAKTLEAALKVSPGALLDALDYCFGDPSKLQKFEEFMKRSRKDSSTREDFGASSFDAFLEQMKQMIHGGKAGYCKELLLEGYVRAMSTQEVTGDPCVDSGSPSLVPETLNVRKAWLDRVVEAKFSADVVREALAMSDEQLVPPGERQQAEMRSAQLQKEHHETQMELTQAEKQRRRTAAVQAQIEAIRQISDTAEPSLGTTSPVDQAKLQEIFIAYEDAALPVISYLETVSEGKGVRWTDEDPQIEIAARVQMQYFDCVRMMQLMAESRGWDGQAEEMKKGLDHCGLQEDDEGHYPDFWGGISDDGEDEGEHVEQRPASLNDAPLQNV